MVNVFMFPANKDSIEDGDLITCIVNTQLCPTFGSLRFCKTTLAFISKYWQAHYLYVTTDTDTLKVGDWCMFYGQPSKVLEINGGSAKIETVTIVTKEDAEVINKVKGKIVIKEGNFSTMTHSFSMKSLPKIVASTDKTLNLMLINEPFINSYIEAHNNGKPIKAEMKTEFVIVN